MKIKKSFKQLVNTLPDLFDISNDTLSLSDDVIFFFENNLFDVVKDISLDKSEETATILCTMNKEVLESNFNATLDDYVCKIISKCLLEKEFLQITSDKLEQIASNNGINLSIYDVDFDFKDGDFQTIGILRRN